MPISIAALAQHYPQLSSPARWLTLASWIGGDRDGNPNVTAEVTAETLRLHRGLAIEHHRRALQDVARRFSFSARRVPPPAELQAWLDARHPLPEHVAFLEKRYADEPYRLTLVAVVRRSGTGLARTDDGAPAGKHAAHRAHPTRRSHRTDRSHRRGRAARAGAIIALHEVQRQLEIFGLHTARLDIREDSSRLTATLGEILRALNIDTTFEQSDDVDSRAHAAALAG